MSDEREVGHECAYDTVGAGPCVTCLTAAPTEAEREALAEWFHRQTCLQPNADYHPLDEDDYAAADDFLPLLAQVKATARAEGRREAAGALDFDTTCLSCAAVLEKSATAYFDGEKRGRAEAWDEGYRSGHSNAMRRMSDEPNAPTTANPYRTDAIDGGAR